MGSYLTNLWWGGDPDIPDPFLGMSRRDIYTVRKNWDTIYAKSAEYGMELFLRLFRKDPTTQGFFRDIAGMTETQIKKTVVFKCHVQNVMSSLNTAVRNLEHPEIVAALMNKLGPSHHRRKIELKHFEEFRDVFVDFLTTDLNVGESALSSWSRFIDFIYRHILEKIKD